MPSAYLAAFVRIVNDSPKLFIGLAVYFGPAMGVILAHIV